MNILDSVRDYSHTRKHGTIQNRKIVPLICIFFAMTGFGLVSQSAPGDEIDLVAIIIPEGTTYLSRYNLRTYENNSYRGLRYVEISGQLNRSRENRYQSSFWQISETTRDLRSVVAGVDQLDRYEFELSELIYTQRPLSGSYPGHLYRFPEYRNFPVLPSAVLYRLDGPGIPVENSSYEAMAYRLVDPEGDGRFTPVQVYVRYIYRGVGEYLGERVHFFDADFALRSDGRLTGFAVQGSNRVTIAVFPGDETRIFMNNSINEQYGLSGGRQIRLEGFGLTWIRSPRPVFTDPVFLRGIASNSVPADENPELFPMPSGNEPGNTSASAPAEGSDQPGPDPPAPDSPGSLPDLPSRLPERISSDGGDIELLSNPLGLSLNLPNIQFRPDSAELLPGEIARINTLIELLKQAPDRRFLVVGHTADVGNPAGQQRLSVERARTVAELLAESGMPPGAIRYEGRGGTEPVGDNASEEGRAANRRVEVIILN
jgi:outer membrane protein OmpA-like peptidoglycan-associated protein